METSSTKDIEQDIEDIKTLLFLAKREHSKAILNKELSELDRQLKIVFSL